MHPDYIFTLCKMHCNMNSQQLKMQREPSKININEKKIFKTLLCVNELCHNFAFNTDKDNKHVEFMCPHH